MMDDLDMRRRRLLWRAAHRGLREMDLVLGGFAARHVREMRAVELDELDAIIATPDQDLLDWILGRSAVPPASRSATLDCLIAFRP